MNQYTAQHYLVHTKTLVLLFKEGYLLKINLGYKVYKPGICTKNQ